MLDKDPPLKRIERLIQHELLPKNCFEECKDEIIDFISRKVIKNQNIKNLKEKKVFTSDDLNQIYFEVFNDKLHSYWDQK